MKKVLAFLLTAIMAVTAFTVAAENPSPEKSSGVIVSVSGEDADGQPVELDIEIEEVAESEETDYNQAVEEIKKETNDSNLKVIDYRRLVLKKGENPKFPLTVNLKVPGIKTTSKVYVLFKSDAANATGLSSDAEDGEVIGLSVSMNFKRVINLASTNGDVVRLDAKPGKDVVTVTFNELGSFALVADAQTVADVTAASEAGSDTTTESNTSTESNASTEETKSPQTADNAASVVVAMLAVSVLAAVISVKKIRTAK